MSEDYVAALLKREARKANLKYSTVGVDALLPQRPTTCAPKPNTRFLKNLIRDTDSHNASLQAKEAEEAAHRRYHSKRRRLDDSEDDDRKPKERNTTQRRPTSSSWLGQDREREPAKHRRSERYRRDSFSEDETYQGRSRNRHRHHHTRKRGRSPEEGVKHRRARSRDSADRLCQPGKRQKKPPSPGFDLAKAFDKARRKRHSHRSRSKSADENYRVKSRDENKHEGRQGDVPESELRGLQEGSNQDRASQDEEPQRRKPTVEMAGSDSDPLEAIIGPAPPRSPPRVRRRGRGVANASSGIDSRFASSYDPTMDIHPNSGSEDDWDQALEALKDRQRWRQQGADRLRAAGFTEEEVATWQKGGIKNEEDVRWKGKGEGREWDRGKILDDDGMIKTAPEWGRLKDM